MIAVRPSRASSPVVATSLFFFAAEGRETGEFSFKQKKQKQKSYHTILSFSF
jgi:hypothetical protein